ncbi:MAG: dienelactone hydrolase family protein [Planctomycetota bacterium]
MTESSTPLRLALSLSALALAASCSETGEEGPNTPTAMGIQTEEITYESDGLSLTGYLALPEGAEGAVPAVVVVHEWWGHNDYVRGRAEQLAGLGYAAFALDMYGDGKLAKHPEDAQAFMQEAMSDADVTAARFEAALEVLVSRDGVDPERTAAIGYCMGGAVVLGMARRGADLDAVVSFHGSLGTQEAAGEGAVTSRVLVCTGADDPFVPKEDVDAFRAEMDAAKASYEVVEYPGVVHAFTNPGATAKGESFGLPLKYDAKADADSWDRMRALFGEAFGD